MLPTGPDITPTYIRNPLTEDFKTTFAMEKSPTEYVVPAQEIVQFPKWLADHIGNQLVRKLALMEPASISWDIREKEAREKVFVTI